MFDKLSDKYSEIVFRITTQGRFNTYWAAWARDEY
ncbi:hypothetical protein SAMN05446037_1006151 [Anaerovirgula multivorans]|uniref:Uncharacterized protein n=1 Tax=Anaerovirgula multivorans TaxID=312168 RepID=A0A239CVM2_9FIRM|nr:hypothetical protein SAMN05446037_1006151 [Anaerovirgula multivorans]